MKVYRSAGYFGVSFYIITDSIGRLWCNSTPPIYSRLKNPHGPYLVWTLLESLPKNAVAMTADEYSNMLAIQNASKYRWMFTCPISMQQQDEYTRLVVRIPHFPGGPHEIRS